MVWNLHPVDPTLPTPVHLQIRRAIRETIRAEALAPGTKLPSVKELSKIFEVNRLTVLKAVQHLIQTGVLRSVQGKGVFTAKGPGRRLGKDGDNEDSDREGRFFDGIAEGPEESFESSSGDRRDAFGRFIADSLDDRMISFAAGFPPKNLLPVDAVRRQVNRILSGEHAMASLGYAGSEGAACLVSQIRNLLLQRGLALDADDRIVVTAGAQQALSLCLERYFENRGALALESPGYMGIIAACRQRNIPMVPVPVDRGGINPKRLAQALKRPDVQGIYTVPTFQNPTGVTQHLLRRKRILALAAARNVLIIEDDTYADLRLGGKAVPPIKSLTGGERVIYVGSFSKSLAPGARIGFFAAKGEIGQELIYLKETADISTGMLSQAIVAGLIENGGYRRHLVDMRKEYRKRRDVMLAALDRELGRTIRVWPPKGGMHLYVMFQQPVDMISLEQRCRAAGVLFAPGATFFSDGRRPSALRLNFTAHKAEVIEEGIRRLAECFRQETEK